MLELIILLFILYWVIRVILGVFIFVMAPFWKRQSQREWEEFEREHYPERYRDK